MSNTFGDDLKDNLPPPKVYNHHSRVVDIDATSQKYNRVDNSKIKLQCAFKYITAPSIYLQDRRFLIWVDDMTDPKEPKFYWESKNKDDKMVTLYKFGPFKTLEEVHADINLIYNFKDLVRDI